MQKLTDAERVLKHTNTLKGRLNRLVIGARASSKAKKYDFSITLNDLFELWEKQNGLCSYTNWPMSTITHDPYLVSIDRINSDKGYILSNIQLTCWQVNRAKSFMSNSDFFAMCQAVANKAF